MEQNSVVNVAFANCIAFAKKGSRKEQRPIHAAAKSIKQSITLDGAYSMAESLFRSAAGRLDANYEFSFQIVEHVVSSSAAFLEPYQHRLLARVFDVAFDKGFGLDYFARKAIATHIELVRSSEQLHTMILKDPMSAELNASVTEYATGIKNAMIRHYSRSSIFIDQIRSMLSTSPEEVFLLRVLDAMNL